MPNFTYNRDVPDAPNNPSNDQGPMKVNTNSNDDLIKEDHYSFNDSNGGLHKKVRLVDLLGAPTGLAAGIGTLYTKLAISTGVSQESNCFYIPDGTTNQYQLTRTITGSFSLFGLLTQNYNGVGSIFFGGWTFLPGGLLLQYGRVITSPVALGTGAPVIFPVPFSGIPFSVQATLLCVAGGTTTERTFSIRNNISATQFIWNMASTSPNYVGFHWMAIGK